MGLASKGLWPPRTLMLVIVPWTAFCLACHADDSSCAAQSGPQPALAETAGVPKLSKAGRALLQQQEHVRTAPVLHLAELDSEVQIKHAQQPDESKDKNEKREVADKAVAAKAEDIYEAATEGLDVDGKAERAGGVSVIAGTVGSSVAVVLLAVACGISGCGRANPAIADQEEQAPPLARYLAEFLGTYFLVLSVGCNVLRGSATWAVASIASTLMVSIYALGAVSGANFNPAVSFSLGLIGVLPGREVVTYICLQVAAGITASLTYGLMLGETFDLKPASQGFTWWQVGFAELFYTFMLCFVVLNACVSSRSAGKFQYYGFAIGFVIVAGGYSAGTISGGAFNPAVALAIEVSSISAITLKMTWSPVYLLFEFLGAGLAVSLFRICRPANCEEDAELEYPLPARLLSEFLGTFMLVLTVGLSVLGASKAAVFAIASSLMCMIFALGSVSGAHFNPAVTTAILCSGRDLISAGHAAAYIGVQILGGIVASFTFAVMENGKTIPLRPAQGVIPALVGEFLFTFLLAFVVLSVATVKSPLSHYFGFAIGSCVMAGGLAIGNISGGSLNPAVSFGLAISNSAIQGGSSSLLNALGYSVAEVFAGAIASVVFAVTYPGELDPKLIEAKT